MHSRIGVHTSRASLTPAVLTLQHPTIFSTTGNDIATAEICEATAGSAGIPWLKTLLTEVRERASTSTGAPTTLKAAGATER
ncbi:hypothetical protein COCCADRAFT_32822 [Bipolaris zeicola 26-R-13]|uniref:Uncharacterized protein n=1 Tax=Cochliobolus carbonum (strain 26-R-13) TaxID=930089 RepID=W6Z369_COCC2|nr:uncharacterized protein COCCADRAFT_32822 [Bipolaris zeicola 26-R-13]EUC38141.1 hypothetical protein COCCADRAFT_32822 [Bipolaris zeicola 26-R-13]